MKNRITVKIPYPNRERVLKELAKWEKLKKYPEQEEVLDKVFKKYKSNDDFDNILIKVSILNDFYSTHILSTYNMALHIYKIKNIDKRMKEGDPLLVERIAKLGNRRYYSFASKYCSFHNPNEYPIYDDFNSQMLRHFRNDAKQDNIDFKFKNKDLKKYKLYKQIINKYRTVFDLEEFNYKNIDRYNWTLGKRKFAKKDK